MCDLDYSGYYKPNQLMSEIFYSLWYFIFNSHEHAIRSDGEQFSNKRQSTPNVSNDFQCHLMICWNLLETQFRKTVLKYTKSAKTNLGKSQAPLLFYLQRSTLNGESRHGLFITGVTKTNLKKGSSHHDCRCSPYYFNSHGAVKTCIFPIQPKHILS